PRRLLQLEVVAIIPLAPAQVLGHQAQEVAVFAAEFVGFGESLALDGRPQVGDPVHVIQDHLVEHVTLVGGDRGRHPRSARKNRRSVAPRTFRVPTSSTTPIYSSSVKWKWAKDTLYRPPDDLDNKTALSGSSIHSIASMMAMR